MLLAEVMADCHEEIAFVPAKLGTRIVTPAILHNQHI